MTILIFSIIAMFLFSYALAFGGITATFIGGRKYYVGMFEWDDNFSERNLLFYCLATIPVSLLMSGSMAERTKIEAMMGFVFVEHIILLPLIFCWAWNLEGGWLRNMGFFDRGGSILVFYIGALGGMVGSGVVGPRYGEFLKPVAKNQIKGGGKDFRKKTLGDLLEHKLDNAEEVDELFL
mmetsp:Transcript_9810/g.7387  ORF Transcript_9810/g.7387 Transcript_9810/m.7387 type:complete len:180 (+) Transcript_9810:151-690(+)|eukprot:CAMPEP_0202961406 /NCGR_PEP_ID=MMETSP1396-20130829/5456_1 /ASSEMBLY_ACC=CAM_ASM_000872 /TAXON_ID= /ORGANISM="Pseudokeronopsis sp., Strain Brazil" /LENGTH=179 /DNA_ID=CAMNT_0049681191 /DNA_START=146 /DNA_END=685 /DNA_ORIENTATION=-